MTEDWGTPEIVRALKRIEAKVDHINDGAVPRGEYSVKMRSLDREIVDLKTTDERILAKIDGKQIPWTAVGSFVVAAVAFGLALVQAVAA